MSPAPLVEKEKPDPPDFVGAPPSSGAATEDFRDHLATADQQGKRRWLYPKKIHGRFYSWRTWTSWLLLAILFGGPFVRINGNPLLLFNIVERRFSILGQLFWPQDMAIFAVAMLLFLTSIIVFTTAFGRLWCGWTCPQTLLMEMVFRKIEYAIEGDSFHQRALDAAPWTSQKILKKTAKHSIFLALSFLIGNTLLSYLIGSDKLIQIITDPPARHLQGLGFMLLFTVVFYALFARFREQACTFICPYGRFQSTMLDENTLVVAYDAPRGEPRGPVRRNTTANASSSSHQRTDGRGDCVDCHLCVAVCPTGIDIRNGTQMECVNCTACIDACDSIMDKLGWHRGLIRYASFNSIQSGQRFRITPRIIGYVIVLCILAGLLAFLVFTRSSVDTTLLRAPGALFQQTLDGHLENLYTLKLINKTSRDLSVQLKLDKPEGKLMLMGAKELLVPKEQIVQSSVLVELAPKDLAGANTKLRIGVYAGGKRIQTLNTIFIGPRSVAPTPEPK